jgi:hypothetical protein
VAARTRPRHVRTATGVRTCAAGTRLRADAVFIASADGKNLSAGKIASAG